MGLPDPEASTGQILIGNLTGLVLDPVGFFVGWATDLGKLIIGGEPKLPAAPAGTQWAKGYYIGWAYDWQAGRLGPVIDPESRHPVIHWDDPTGSDKSAGILVADEYGLPVARVHIDSLSGAHIQALWGFNPQGYPLFSNAEQSDTDNLAATGRIYEPLAGKKHYSPAGSNAVWCMKLGIDPENPVIVSSGRETRPNINPALLPLGLGLAGFILSGGLMAGAVFGGIAGGLLMPSSAGGVRRPSRSRGAS